MIFSKGASTELVSFVLKKNPRAILPKNKLFFFFFKKTERTNETEANEKNSQFKK